MKQFAILDERDIWHGPACAAARARGWEARRLKSPVGYGVQADLAFIRPHAEPRRLLQNLSDDLRLRMSCPVIQDRAQVEVYENKTEQFRRWGAFMPRTVRFTTADAAFAYLAESGTPEVLVSKADVGASSVNVRILRTRQEQREHVARIFSRGIPVDHCAGGGGVRRARSLQKDYVLLQEFMPGNDLTWRVNIVGNCYAIFKRYNYPDRPVAQTGNVDPVLQLDAETESLLEFSKSIFRALGTHWCAIDVLRAPDGEWKLIETSLAWPWPSPGDCMNAQFFGNTTRKWDGMWELMFDEYEGGAWDE